MFVVNSNITIGDLVLDFVHKGKIKTSWKDLTDRCTISLPRKITVVEGDRKKPIQEVIKKGDPVTVSLGYDSNLTREFTGFVSEVKTGVPLVIECEDNMWLLKQSSDINKSWKSANLKDVVDHIAPDFENEVLSIDLGAFRIQDVNAAEVLDKIKKAYGMKVFFRDEKLYVGFAFPFDKFKTVDYHFQQNVVEKGNKLKYRSEDDIRISVTATSILPNNEKFEVKVGDSDGAKRTLHYFNLSEKALKAAAERDLRGLKFSGFRGSFKAFGVPAVSHGDVAALTDEFYPDHNGGYFVDSVTTEFGFGVGIKRQIELGPLADNQSLEVANVG